MPDTEDNTIVLRPTPGRDATASEIARSRGEFRRRPHVEVITIEIDVEPKAAETPKPAEKPKAARKAPKQPAREAQYGRTRMHH
jgi:hypothetical protein